MHSIAVVAALFAASAIAGPAHNHHAQLHKRHPYEVVEMSTVVDWTYDTVTVTAGHIPTSSAAPIKAQEYKAAVPKKEHKEHHETPPAALPTYPTSTSSVAPPPTSTYVPAPASSSSKAAPASTSASSSSTSGSGSDSYGSGSYQETILSKHKTLRANFGHGELVWNDTLASLAQQMVTAASASGQCVMAHSHVDAQGNSVSIGQNLAMGTDNDPKGTFTQVEGQVQSWYGPEEYNGYASISNNFQSPPSIPSNGQVNGNDVLHFSQLVWKGTEQIGCYTKTDCPGLMNSLTFCNYYPPGNVASGNDANPNQPYLENVGQPTSGSSY